MAKKKTKKTAAKKAPPIKEAPAAEQEEEIVFEKAEPEPAMIRQADGQPIAMAEEPARQPMKKDNYSMVKMLAVAGIFILALALAYYFFVLSAYSFAPGTSVDEETFKGIFLDSQKAYIVMDVRGITDPQLSNNVMQCGVDFAASSAFATKSMVPLSIGSEGCVTPGGPTPMERCFSMLSDGVTVYVRGGDGAPQYYSNGMVVHVGKDYTFGTCGIKRTQ